MADLTYGNLFLTTILLIIGYGITLVVYRLYLSPLSKFPGPKLAAATQWVEFYYDVVCQGQFIFYIQDMHKQYGPIVRINPHELHILDSEFYDDLYVKPSRADKYDWMKGRFNIPSSIFNTPEADLHKIRRAPLSPLFSKKKILDLQDIVREKVDKLIRHVQQAQTSQQPFSIDRAFMACAADVASEYAFAQCFNYMDQDLSYGESIHDSAMAASESSHLFLHFPLVAFLMNSLPEKWVIASYPKFALLFRMQKQMGDQIRAIKSGDNTSYLDVDHPTIFHKILESDLPEAEKSDLRLAHEAQLVVAAAVSTTGMALCQAIFQISNNPETFSKLRTELDNALIDPNEKLDWLKLEKLPYLGGCVREAIRLSYVVAARNPRLLNTPLRYKDYVIPPRTPVSMTLVDLAHDEKIFPDSWKFKPERWTFNKGEETSRLDKYFVFFGKGNRQCLGQNLALAEMHLIIASIFRRFELELYETDESDVRMKYDFFLPAVKKDSKGIRVIVKAEEY